MPRTIIDDHLLRDVLVGRRAPDLHGLAIGGLSTTSLWLFRLCASFAEPTVAGRLSRPVAALPAETRAAFRAKLVSLPADITVVGLPALAWPMAELQTRHRAAGRGLSAAMVEALAAAHELGASIVVSEHDVGPALNAAATADGIPFHVL